MLKPIFCSTIICAALLATLGLAGCSTPEALPTVTYAMNAHMGEVPFEVTFADNSALPQQKCGQEDPPKEITGWTWDFGDGATGSGAQVSHTYANPGLYSVKLTIAVSDGTSYSATRRNVVVALDPDRVQGAAAGEERTVAGIDFVWIPAGTFTMGSDVYSYENETYLEEDASPAHEATITQGFWLAKYEMRQDYWLSVMGDNPALFDELDPSAGFPLESVSWTRCQDFLDVMNARGEGLFRLPTEAEWEYACRAGTTEIFSFPLTETDLLSHVCCTFTSPYSTQPVGSFLPNPWGLYDMHGNVWEWMQDVYNSDYYTEEAKQDPFGPDTGPYRSVRGGSFRDPFFLLTSSTRTGYVTSSTYPFLGFRLALQ